MRPGTNIGIAVLLLATAFGCGRTEAPKAGDTPSTASNLSEPESRDDVVQVSDEMLRDLRITTSTVELHQGGESASLLGELGVNLNAYAEVSAPLAARVVSLQAVEGAKVRKGELLATLESGELARARGDHATAEARQRLAQRTLERRRELAAEKIVPAREVQEAESDAMTADAELRAARATLEALGDVDQMAATGARLLLRSPVDGTVLERTLALGQTADPSQPLFRIGDLSSLWLTVQAFERDAVRVAVGAPARITFAALPGQSFQGSVALVGQGVDPASRTVAVRIVLANPNGNLRPGMSASAWLPVGDQGTLLAVPAGALQRVRDRWCVFVPKDDRTFEIRPIGRGRDIAGEVEILSGVRAGERIVVDGAFLLKAEAERSGEGGHEGRHE